MKILAVDTAEWKISLALWEDGKELAFSEHTHPQDQAALLPQLIEDILKGHTVDLFLINTGPGSFTGIRIGFGFMKGLSRGLGIPLKGMDKFTALSQSLTLEEPLLILIDAHRQDIFGQLVKGGKAAPPQSFTREEISHLLSSPHPPLITGSRFHDFLSPLSYKEVTPEWTGAQCLAHAFFKDPTLALPPAPLYVRLADVSLPSPPKGLAPFL